MLRQRLLTAAVLIPAVVWIVLALPTRYFAAVTALVLMLGAWEWAALMGVRDSARRTVYVVLTAALALACAWLITVAALRYALLVAVALWWLRALSWIRRFGTAPDAVSRRLRPFMGSHFQLPWLFGMLGAAVLVPAWLALVMIHGRALSGPQLVLLLMVVVWGADSGAYFAGRLWGKTKLAPQVSPGKTWEGVYGGLAVAVTVAIAGSLLLGFGWRMQVSLVLLSIVTVLFSIIGDLFQSMVKRLAGVKDSGHLLPGHGGVLDRIDSLTAAAPLFALGLLWQGMIA